MLSAGRAHQQARHAWVALAWARQAGDRFPGSSSSLTSDNHLVCAGSDPDPWSKPLGDQLGRVPLEVTDRERPSVVGTTRILSSCASLPSNPSVSASRNNDVSRRTADGSAYAQCSRLSFIPACWAGNPALSVWVRVASAPAPLGSRSYHTWYYGSKLRNKAIKAATSLDQLEDMLRQDGDRLDHINLALFLRQLQLAAASETAAAAMGSAQASSPSSSSATTGSSSAQRAAAPAGFSSPSSAVAAAMVVATSQAVEQQVARVAARASRLVRKRAKWFEPRYAAAVVFRTAVLGFTDGRMLHELTGRVLTRLNEAYSRDLLVLLRGLHTHAAMSAAAATTAASNSPVATTATAHLATASQTTTAQYLRHRGRQPKAGTYIPYMKPPEALWIGVEAFLLAKLPTGRMPPDSVDGLLRYFRALSGRPIGSRLCAAAEEDLRRRLAIYGPQPLAGLLSTFAAERYQLPLELLTAAADQFTAHALEYGTGASAERLLTAAATILRYHAQTQQSPASTLLAEPRKHHPQAHPKSDQPATASAAPAAAGIPPSPGEWVSSRPVLLSACLSLMARDLSAASPERLSIWLQALAHAEAPLAALAASVSSTPGLPAPAAAVQTASMGYPSAPAAARAFVAAIAAVVERALPGLAPEAVSRLRKAYDAVGLPYPLGL